jgi:hypothetical protein
MFGISIDIYIVHDILVNLDSYVNIYNEFNPNIINKIYSINVYTQ